MCGCRRFHFLLHDDIKVYFMKKLIQLSALLTLCLGLQGCVVAAAADLVGTTVLTAGKLAVKGTGALIDAAIPDGDDDDKDKKKKKKKDEDEDE